jgi:hypothetical protein
MDSIFWLLWFAGTYFLATILCGIVDGIRGTDDLEEQLKKHLDEILHRVVIEENGNMYYWFDQDDNEFLAQGTTTEEIIDALKKRYPDHIFYLQESEHLLCAKHDWKPVAVNKSN